MANINIYPSTTTQTFTTSTQDILLKGVNSGLMIYNADTGTTERFTISGSTGTIFSVSDSQTGLLWSVNDIAANPISEIYSDARVIYPEDAKLGIGTDSPTHQVSIVNTDTTSTGAAHLILKSPSTYGVKMTFESTATSGKTYGVGSNFISGNGDFGIYDYTSGATRLQISSTGDISIGPTAYFYIGNSSTDGSWRFYISGTDLVFERRVSSTWTEKGRFTN